jgi:transposase-like protein
MTKNEDRSKIVAIKELLERDEDFVRTAVQGFVQAALEAEMTEVLAAEKVNGPRDGSAIAAAITKGL